MEQSGVLLSVNRTVARDVTAKVVGSGALLGDCGLGGVRASSCQSLGFHSEGPALQIRGFLPFLALASFSISRVPLPLFFRVGVARVARECHRLFCRRRSTTCDCVSKLSGLLPNVQDEPRPWLARAVLLGARIVTAMVVGSGALFGGVDSVSK